MCKKSASQDVNLEKVCIFSGERNYGLLSTNFEKSIVEIQMHVYHGRNVENKADFLCVKKALFRMVIWIRYVFSQEKELRTSNYHF